MTCVRNGVILDGPAWLLEHRSTRTVSVDSCIAETVRQLWAAGVITLGSCCGHDEAPPSLVLGNHENGVRVRKLLARLDDRGWDLYQWRLKQV